jgi:cyclopropane fatty-acyl-phospholipid synthase-like methyltransferase
VTGQPHDFDSIYATGTPPWDIGRPQPAFVVLANIARLVGRVLDVGCGTGEHALLAATLGREATGLDISARAVAMAQDKAAERGLNARFVEWNALELSGLNEQFDTVLDCGLFHVFEDQERPRFVDGLRASMSSGGVYYMLCFSDRQPGDWGPRRIRQEEIRHSFADGWTVESIQPATIEIAIDTGSAEAWLASIART